MKRYCEDIAGFIERFGDDLHIFSTDKAYFNAVSMCILQIGELANGLSQEFRTATKDEMHWNMARGMRNWIAHAYNELEIDVVWGTAKDDIPNLLRFCDKVIEKAKPASSKSAKPKDRDSR
jgi:uncharacterized protein with HEPN domain